MLTRCATCRMPQDDCLCTHITPLATRTRVSVVLHSQELAKPSNTGRLAHLALANSELLVHGTREGVPVSLGPVDASYAGRYLLFPGEGALPLEDLEVSGKPLHLVVADGTWGQAQRMVKRIPALASLPRVSVSPRGPSRYVLRHTDVPGRLCTLEAIAAAFASLEGELVAQALERLLTMVIERSSRWRSSSQRGELYAQRHQGA